MKKFLNKIKCFLGHHDWLDEYDALKPIKCKHCKAVTGIYKNP